MRLFFFLFQRRGIYRRKKSCYSGKDKTQIIVNHVARDIDVSEDCLFAIFHSQKKQWINKFDSFIAERIHWIRKR